MHRIHYAGLERRQDEILDIVGMDNDTRALWTLRDRLGWGRRKLLRYYGTMLRTHAQLHANWRADKYRAIRYELEAVGINCDEMIGAAQRRAMVLKANMPEYIAPPKVMDVESRLIDESLRIVRGAAKEYETLTIYILHFDFGVSRPKIQQCLNDIMMHYATYDLVRDADEYARLRGELMEIGVNVAVLQRDAEACIAAEKAAEMEGESE